MSAERRSLFAAVCSCGQQLTCTYPDREAARLKGTAHADHDCEDGKLLVEDIRGGEGG